MNTVTTKDLFTDKSESYAKYRPGYPPETINKILQPFESPAGLKAVDVGAGTGIASRILADRKIDVIAAEPNASMIESATPHPGVTYKQMNAENLSVKSSSADIVTSFQSFHWFDFKKSLREFRRVLKQEGQLALVWNYWDTRDPFTSRYARLINTAADKNPDRVSPYDEFPRGAFKKMRVKMLWKLRYIPYFKTVRRYQYRYVREANLEALKGSARSQSYLLHEGKTWDQLISGIEKLHGQSSHPHLVYAVNLFTAQPKK